MSQDFVVAVRQLAQYPIKAVPQPTDLFLIQEAGIGGAYRTIQYRSFWTGVPGMALGILPPPICKGLVTGFATTPLGTRQGFNWYTDIGGNMRFLQNGYAGLWSFADYELSFSVTNIGYKDDIIPIPQIPVFQIGLSGQMKIAGQLEVARVPVRPNEVVTLDYLVKQFPDLLTQSLNAAMITKALGLNPCDPLATQSWVNNAICAALNSWYYTSPMVFSFNGRVGTITLTDADITAACTAPGAMPQTVTPPPGDYSYRIANTMFVGDALDDLKTLLEEEIGNAIGGSYAPLNSPQFTGVPTAPTANPGTTTGQIATTAFVMNAVTESTTGVASFNTRTGAVILEATDISSAGGALINSPAFTGNPTAPTQAPGNNTNELATCAFVEAALAAFVPTTGVQTFNTRTGAVVLTTADVTGAGGAPNASPVLTGVPAAPTAAPGTNTTQLATTAFVTAAIAALGSGVASWNGRVGAVTLQANDISAVGGALINSPTFTGTPAAPTANPGTSTSQIATTGFVMQALSGVNLGVTSFNTRTGTVTLNSTDITGAGGALLASPAFTGAPSAPTPAQTSNDGTLATTSFVKSAIAGAALVTSFNGRSGVVTLQGSDISAAGGALTASPGLTGTPTAPTAAVNTNTTQIATTAFVVAQLATAGGVNSFNGRAGAVTLTAADVQASNALPLANGFVSKFYNNGFLVNLRAPGAVSPTANGAAMTCDGWRASATATTAPQWSIVNQGNFRGNALRFTMSVATTALTVLQRIESLVAQQLFNSDKSVAPVTVQWKVFNNSGAAITPNITITAPSAADNWGGTNTVITGPQAAPNIANGASAVVAYTFMLDPTLANGLMAALSFPNVAGGTLDVAEADIRKTPGVAVGFNTSPPVPELIDIALETRRSSRYYQTIARIQMGNFIQAGQIAYVATTFPWMRTSPTANFGMNAVSGGAVGWNFVSVGNNCAQGSMTQGGADGTVYGYWSGTLTAEL